MAAWIADSRILDEQAVSDFTVMVEAPTRFLAALPQFPDAVVYASSIEVYGAPETLPVAEEHPTNPTRVYGAAKLAGEHFLRISLRDTDASFAALRLAFVYGPGQHEQNAIPRFLAGLRRGDPPRLRGSGSEVRDDVFVGDVARAMHLALTNRADGVFNIATGRPHTLLAVADAACKISDSQLQPVVGAEPTSWIDRWYAVAGARDAFGFEAQTSLDDGLRSMWMSERVG